MNLKRGVWTLATYNCRVDDQSIEAGQVIGSHVIITFQCSAGSNKFLLLAMAISRSIGKVTSRSIEYSCPVGIATKWLLTGDRTLATYSRRGPSVMCLSGSGMLYIT